VKAGQQKRVRSKPEDISPAELAMHVERLHRVLARYLGSVAVKETQGDRTVWEGVVSMFSLKDHPSGATKAYAWTYPTAGGKRRIIAMLEISPVNDAATAVRTVILAQVREAEHAKNEAHLRSRGTP
jgi:hypothetical protein